MVQIASIKSNSLWKDCPTIKESNSEKVDLMFDFNNTVNQKKQTNNNDQRPNISREQKEWINGHYKNVKSLNIGINSISFIINEDTEDGYEEIKVTLHKTNDNRTIISEDRFGKGFEVIYYEIDNETGKILSKQSRTGDYLSQRRIYQKNGEITTNNTSLEKELLNSLDKDVKIDFQKQPKNGPIDIVW